jgi:hypothetical protein
MIIRKNQVVLTRQEADDIAMICDMIGEPLIDEPEASETDQERADVSMDKFVKELGRHLEKKKAGDFIVSVQENED